MDRTSIKNILTENELTSIDGFFKAANYLSCIQIYLLDNPLLTRPLTIDDVKPRLVGHWGTAPGQNFIYAHLNRIIKNNLLDMIYISGPGHGGQAMISNNYLEGTYSLFYPEITEDIDGIKKLCKRFSFPKGVSSHVAPETPGSINEGGELGYSLAHAYGAVLDNPDLIAACVIGDGEAETGSLATSWHLNKFINPLTDGVVLPILHLNGYKIANPTILGRMSDDDLEKMFEGMGYEVLFVEGHETRYMHQRMAEVLDYAITKIKNRKILAKSNIKEKIPMIILRSPKGWTGPKIVDGKQVEDSFRSHQVPIVVDKEHQELLPVLNQWLKSYKPEELFDETGKLRDKYKLFVPDKEFRMGLSKYANGGLLTKKINLPNVLEYGIEFDKPGSINGMDMKELGRYLKDVIKYNPTNFRIFGPDEALSNRLNYVFEETNREWNMSILPTDDYLNNRGRVIDSFLSENVCEGLLEGYVLTGRHGIFHTYEAFSRIIDSMVSQHTKWIKASKEISWRKPVPSVNIILTSHIWQQDHNGYTHQEPGFLNHLITKKKDQIGLYLPADANTLICTINHCLKTQNKVNAIVASKHERPEWLNMSSAIKHFNNGASIWSWASDKEPNIILGCAGDTPTLEVLAAKTILKKYIPDLKVRVVNVVNLLKLDKSSPEGLTDEEYNYLFTENLPIIFVFHGYPNLIKELTLDRQNKDITVLGYIEEGAITTPFDMRVKNKIDRFNICLEVTKHISDTFDKFEITNYAVKELIKHNVHIVKYGKDLEEVENWKWNN